MSYQVLARKWRPKNFNEIIGQEHVTRTLTNALNQQRLHHGYLFTGTRGVGKTTIARIFAKCLNCLTGVTATPCGKCQTCQEIDQGCLVDLLEVDAASRTKVEDTRELLENIQYAPAYGRYKIYLIDEVHMLSNHSFNALLKTLEEPPAHVKFLLATTDVQKLPITILSRCLQFNLKTVSPEKIAQHLAYILRNEKIDFTEEALGSIANAAAGSVRDALSLLDQAIAYSNGKLTIDEVDSMLGTVSKIQVSRLLAALAEHDGNRIFTIIQEFAEDAVNFTQVAEELLSLLHDIALHQLIPNFAGTTLDKTASELSKFFSPEQIQLYYQIALTGRRDLPLASTLRSGFEMLMLRMLAFHMVDQQAELKLPQSIIKTKQVEPKKADVQILPKISIPETLNESNSPDPEWTIILPQLNLSPVTRAIAERCTLLRLDIGEQDAKLGSKSQVEQQQIVHLQINKKHTPLWNPLHEKQFNEALSNFYHQPTKIILEITDEDIKHTPWNLAEKELKDRELQAINNFKDSSEVQSLVKEFGAKIIEESVKEME